MGVAAEAADAEDGAEGARRHALAKEDPVRRLSLREHVPGAKWIGPSPGVGVEHGSARNVV